MALELPAGGDCVSGNRQGYGSGCTKCFWIVFGEADQIEWERACLDSASIPAKRGAEKPERIRQIKEKRARSATLFRTEEASRWR